MRTRLTAILGASLLFGPIGVALGNRLPMSRYLLCAIAGLFWASAACAQPCHLSVSYKQLNDIAHRFHAIAMNINSMSEAASTPDPERDALSSENSSQITLLGMLGGTTTVIEIRDLMVSDKDRQTANFFLTTSLRTLSGVSKDTVEYANGSLMKLRTPAAVAEVTAARNILSELVSLLKNCPP